MHLNYNYKNYRSSYLFKTPNDPFSFKIKKMPQTALKEALNLMHEEAFFLSFGLGCLDVLCEMENRNLSNLELWERFVKFDSDFPFRYAVYHKLRSKGWIIKNGIKYGCDFLAYFEGPDRHHASYSIRVKRKDLKDLQEEFDSDLDEFHAANLENDQFTQFSALIRINETVSKEVMLCYVIYDTTASDEINFAKPSCLKQMRILDVLVNRWIPKENRDVTDEKPSTTSNANKNSDASSISAYFKSFNDLDDDDD
jgi:tRNA-splicing endonuclease subunit Sen2